MKKILVNVGHKIREHIEAPLNQLNAFIDDFSIIENDFNSNTRFDVLVLDISENTIVTGVEKVLINSRLSSIPIIFVDIDNDSLIINEEKIKINDGKFVEDVVYVLNQEIKTQTLDIRRHINNAFTAPWTKKFVKDLFIMKLENMKSEISNLKFSVWGIDFEELNNLIGDFLEPEDKIFATCFTEMEEFYFKRGIGHHYFKMNLSAFLNHNIEIIRIFGVTNNWEKENILLREMIRLYQHFGMTVFTVKTDEVHYKIGDIEDFFLVCDSKGSPKGILDFNVTDTGDLLNLSFDFTSDNLSKKKDYFHEDLLPISHKVETFDNFPQEANSVGNGWVLKYIENCSKSVRNSNFISYVKKPLDDITSYWEGLEASLIRPPKRCVDEITMTVKRISQEKQLTKALVLGSTPEMRILANHYFEEVHVVDINKAMYDAMSKVIRNYTNDTNFFWKKERFHLLDWRMVNILPELGFDCVFGIDVLNMLIYEDLSLLFSVLHDVLKDDGCVVMQWVEKPIDDAYFIFCKTVQGEFSNKPDIYEVLEEQLKSIDSGDGAIDHHELFARICFSQYDEKSDRVEIGKVVDFLNSPVFRALHQSQKYKSEKSEPYIQKIIDTYYLCNTTLNMCDLRNLKQQFQTYFEESQKSPYFSMANPQDTYENLCFNNLFSIVTLQKTR